MTNTDLGLHKLMNSLAFILNLYLMLKYLFKQLLGYLILLFFCIGGSRSGHGEESGRGGTRYATHQPPPGDSAPSVPQTRSRRPHDIVPAIAAAPNPLDDVITSSK